MTLAVTTPAAGTARLFPGAIDSYVATRVPICSPDEPVAVVRSALHGRDFEAIDDVAVCEGPPEARVLVGLIPAETLFTASATQRARDIMDGDPPVVSRTTDEEKAAWKAVAHGESSLAVLDSDGHFLGIVPPARLLGVLLRSHDTDFARLGGYTASAASARHALDEPVAQRLWHRLPWLLLGLAGAGLSAWVVGLFGDRLEADVRLAFFIPGVVYMADAIGTQTEALLIRGMSAGVSLRKVVAREAVTGPVIGALMGLAALPLVWLVLGSLDVAVAVALALFGACGVATVVALALPWAMSARGKDPAFGSGPLSTVIQDLLSLIIYFAVAALVVG